MDKEPDTIPDAIVNQSDQAVNVLVSIILRIGLLSACALMILGATIHLFQHPEHDLQLAQFHSEPEALRSIGGTVKLALSGNGLGVMQLAVLVLLATPFLRIIFAGIAFARQLDWKFVVISCIVLGTLLYGLFAGHALQ